MCLWCYHHILEEAGKESLPARCPNCRVIYDQNKIQIQHIDAQMWVVGESDGLGVAVLLCFVLISCVSTEAPISISNPSAPLRLAEEKRKLKCKDKGRASLAKSRAGLAVRGAGRHAWELHVYLRVVLPGCVSQHGWQPMPPLMLDPVFH